MAKRNHKNPYMLFGMICSKKRKEKDTEPEF